MAEQARGQAQELDQERALLRQQIAWLRDERDRLRADVAQARQALGGEHCAQLLEANEQLVQAVLRAQSEADTAAQAAAQALREATRLAEIDVLTQLPNRLLLLDRLSQAMAGARRRATGAAVLFVDLDRFKQINDDLGHAVGDAVLQQVAWRLAAAIRAVDTISRHGGDEFLIVMADVLHADDVLRVADKLVAALAAPCQVGRHRLMLGASIGISLFPDDAEEAQTLIDMADAAMYRAKRLGSRCCLYAAIDSGSDRARGKPTDPAPQRWSGQEG